MTPTDQDVGIIHENHDHSNKVYQEMFNVGMDISKEVKKVMISLWATPEVKVNAYFYTLLLIQYLLKSRT